MKGTPVLFATMLSVTLFLSGCQEENAVDKTVEGSKDALNMREHEELKDAAEEAKKAVEDAAQEVQDAIETR